VLSVLTQACFASTGDPHSVVAKAEKLSSLAGPGAQPFHLRLTISQPAGSNSQYAATVEEYWKTEKDWTRSINAPLQDAAFWEKVSGSGGEKCPLTQKRNKLSGSIIGTHKGIEPYFLRAAVRDKPAASPGSEASLDGWSENFHS
jgi:hypothetical protein